MSIKFKQRLLVVLLTLSLAIQGNCDYECKQGENCELPDCFCATFDHPLGPKNVPQIVYFGFDDAVTPMVIEFYNKLFRPYLKNPNGCPITMTLYVCNQYTNYSQVNVYYKEGDEIGSHSVTHTNIDTREKLLREAREQKENIEFEGGVSKGDVVGWRSPNLKTAGDAQPDVLAELGYTYDISLTYSHDKQIPWPFTLDYGNPYPCMIPPCPATNTSHKGFWEVMVNSLYDPQTGLPCGFVDGCRPKGEEAAVEYLWTNFLRNYQTTRAPFGLNMHAAWFYVEEYLNATRTFIDRLLSKEDVYIINVKQMMAWMRTPVPLADVKSFEPWGCDQQKLFLNQKTSTGHRLRQTVKEKNSGSRPLVHNDEDDRRSISKASRPTYQSSKDITSHDQTSKSSFLVQDLYDKMNPRISSSKAMLQTSKSRISFLRQILSTI